MEVISERMRDKIAARHDGELTNVTGSGPVVSGLGDVSGSHSAAALSTEACQLPTCGTDQSIIDVCGGSGFLDSGIS